MTTKITVEPAGHHLRVELTEGENVTVEQIEPGADPIVYWIYNGRSLTVIETGTKGHE